MSSAPPPVATDRRPDVIRRRIVWAATFVTAFALMHHVDHVIRGEIVASEGLKPGWDHSGWPFKPELTPFTASLVVYVLLIPGIAFTLRRRLGGGYWVVAGLIMSALVVWVHFVPVGETESPNVIYNTYDGGTAAVIALVVLTGLLAGLAYLVIEAVRLRRAEARR